MTTVFKVQTRHTMTMLQDFVRFDRAVRHPKMNLRLLIMGIGFVVLGFMAGRDTVPDWVSILFYALAVLQFALLFLSHKLGGLRLAASDRDYQDKNEIVFEFDTSGFWIRNEGNGTEIRGKYRELTGQYQDRRNCYLCRNNEEVYLIPRKDFTVGESEEFERFVTNRTGKDWIEINVPVLEKLRRINRRRVELEQLHDERIEKQKQEKKKKKTQER